MMPRSRACARTVLSEVRAEHRRGASMDSGVINPRKERYVMERPRMQQTMPEDRTGWHQIDAGPHLEVLFHPNRRPGGREPDEIVRPSIVVAVAGKREQALRFDPFSMGAHYHIRPGLAEQIPLPIKEGQS